MLPFLGAMQFWGVLLNEIPVSVFTLIIVVFAFLVVIGFLRWLLNAQ